MKGKYLKVIALGISLILSLPSCIVYHPQTTDIPLIEKKGDLRVEASAWTSALITPDAVGGSATLSYGLTNFIAGQLHASLQDVRNYNLQAAAGAYKAFGLAVLEAYAGVNYGKSYREVGSTRSYDQEIASGSAATYFAQVNFGWNHLLKSHLDIGFGLKVGAFVPDYTCMGYVSVEPETPEFISEMTQHQTLVEPRVFLRVGGESVKLQLGVSYCQFSGSGFSDNPHFQYDPVSLSLGLSFRF